jgi:hypothetical protein
VPSEQVHIVDGGHFSLDTAANEIAADTTIQAILRHENVSTTQSSYIKTARLNVTAAMKRPESKLQCAAVTANPAGKRGQVIESLEPTIGLEPMTCRLRIA